jgi:hypothetical protein
MTRLVFEVFKMVRQAVVVGVAALIAAMGAVWYMVRRQ